MRFSLVVATLVVVSAVQASDRIDIRKLSDDSSDEQLCSLFLSGGKSLLIISRSQAKIVQSKDMRVIRTIQCKADDSASGKHQIAAVGNAGYFAIPDGHEYVVYNQNDESYEGRVALNEGPWGTRLAFSPTGNFLLMSSRHDYGKHELKIYDCLKRTAETIGFSDLDVVHDVDFLDEESVIVAGTPSETGDDGSMAVFSISDRNRTANIFRQSDVLRVSVNRQKQLVFCMDSEGIITEFGVHNKELLFTRNHQPAGGLRELIDLQSFDDEGRLLIGAQHHIRIYDIGSKQIIGDLFTPGLETFDSSYPEKLISTTLDDCPSISGQVISSASELEKRVVDTTAEWIGFDRIKGVYSPHIGVNTDGNNVSLINGNDVYTFDRKRSVWSLIERKNFQVSGSHKILRPFDLNSILIQVYKEKLGYVLSQYDYKTGKLVDLGILGTSYRGLCFSPNGRFLAVIREDKTIFVSIGNGSMKKITEFPRAEDVIISNSGKLAVLLTDDGQVVVNLQTGENVISKSLSGPACFSADDRFLFGASKYTGAWRMDLDSGKISNPFSLYIEGPGYGCPLLVAHPKLKIIATWYNDSFSQIQLFDSDTGDLLANLDSRDSKSQLAREFSSVQFSEDGQYLVGSDTRHGAVVVWEVKKLLGTRVPSKKIDFSLFSTPIVYRASNGVSITITPDNPVTREDLLNAMRETAKTIPIQTPPK